MKFDKPLVSGTFIRRYRRSLVDVKLDDGTVATAHCPGFGTMAGCVVPGRPVRLSDSQNPQRLHPLTWELIDIDGVWVGVNPAVARKLVLNAIENKRIPSLLGYEIQTEARYGTRKTIDIILQGMEQNCFVTVHSVSWVKDGTALYPDSINERAQQALLEQTEIVKQGHRAVAFFVVQRNDCTNLKPAEDVDREFLRAMLAADNAGVEFLVYRSVVAADEISLDETIPYSLD